MDPRTDSYSVMALAEIERARVVDIISSYIDLKLDQKFAWSLWIGKVYIDIMGEITVTKDGSAILRKLDVEHPAAKILIECSECSRQ